METDAVWQADVNIMYIYAFAFFVLVLAWPQWQPPVAQGFKEEEEDEGQHKAVL